MLNHPTHERLIELGLTGMAKAFEEQRRSPDLEALPFEDRIGLLVDREAAAARRTGWKWSVDHDERATPGS